VSIFFEGDPEPGDVPGEHVDTHLVGPDQELDLGAGRQPGVVGELPHLGLDTVPHDTRDEVGLADELGDEDLLGESTLAKLRDSKLFGEDEEETGASSGDGAEVQPATEAKVAE